jgi:2-dehydro-3-deoxyphosphogluconate aldolase / (4S)-4-hydroxy-2-oxoglutarate aldolase
MNTIDTVKRLLGFGIVPIIRTGDENKIAIAAEALAASGLGVIEISLSVPHGLAILEKIADRFGDIMLLGAGTVLDAGTARAAISAGARFIVSPVTDGSVIDICKKCAVPVFPGALTPTEIVHAWNLGADAIKVFPVNAAGGPSYIRALRAPLPNIVLFPCGSVNTDNAADYFVAGAAALLVGSALIDPRVPDRELSDRVTKKALQFIEIAATARTSRP